MRSTCQLASVQSQTISSGDNFFSYACIQTVMVKLYNWNDGNYIADELFKWMMGVAIMSNYATILAKQRKTHLNPLA